MESTHRSSPLVFPVARLTAAYVVAGLASNLFPAGSRAAAALGLIATVSLVAFAGETTSPRRRGLAVLGAATVLALIAIQGWRRLVDPGAVIGPVPSSLEPLALGVLGGINLAVGTLAVVSFSARGRMFRWRWGVVAATECALLLACVLLHRAANQATLPQGLLQRVVMLEQTADRNSWAERQELSAALAILGRPHESRAIPRSPDALGQVLSEIVDTPAPAPRLRALPWREAIGRIAAEHRLVLIMEDHAVSEHRAWIEQTLEPFRAAGFTDYQAEAIAEPSASLRARGYPAARTGFYTLDPRFGNLVRSALGLGFEVGGYDLADSDFDRRETYQAATLTARLASGPRRGMIVHVGHGHVFKHEVNHVGRYMAARLWRASGIEPFTIWQLSHGLPDALYRDLVRQVGPIGEPVVLAPPPRDVSEKLFPESSVHPAVDALVIHPSRPGREPRDRRGTFAGTLRRVPGQWLGGRWPVLIAAFAPGEPDDAVPLDQVMLRPGETAFELWVPQPNVTIRVWSLDGPMRVDVHVQEGAVRIGLAKG